MAEHAAAEVRQVAKELLRSGRFGGPTSAGAEVLDPLAVQAPDGRLHAWFVPVARGEALIGFAELLPNLTMTRYSSFQRDPSSLEGCPPRAAWTHPPTVLATLEPYLRPGEVSGRPVLSFDRVPARLAWAVVVSATDGTSRTLYVAGSAVWEGASGGHEDTVGGPGARSKPRPGPP